mgnify:FL=1
MNKNKYIGDLISFAKAAGAFQYETNRFVENGKSGSRNNIDATFNNLEQHQYNNILPKLQSTPTNQDLQSIKEIADYEMKAMRMLYNNL